MLPPLKPIPIKDRLSIVFVEKGEIDVVDGAFVVVDQQGFRVRPVLTHIPVGAVLSSSGNGGRGLKLPTLCGATGALTFNYYGYTVPGPTR